MTASSVVDVAESLSYQLRDVVSNKWEIKRFLQGLGVGQQEKESKLHLHENRVYQKLQWRQADSLNGGNWKKVGSGHQKTLSPSADVEKL